MASIRLIPCADPAYLPVGTVVFFMREHSDLPGDDYVVDGAPADTGKLGYELVTYLAANVPDGQGYVYIVEGETDRKLILRMVDSEDFLR